MVKVRNDVVSDLKEIFFSYMKVEVLEQLNAIKVKWLPKYSMPVYSVEKKLSILLKYCHHPEQI